jgi:hypothetical protein
MKPTCSHFLTKRSGPPRRPAASPFERLLKRLRIPAGAPEGVLAAEAWDEALALAAPASIRLRLSLPDFLARFNPYAQASSHLMSRLEGHTEVWLLAATIGSALEGRARDLFAGGRAFSGYLIEYFGIWLVDQALRGEIAALRSLPDALSGALTKRLMPGCQGFPLEAQAVFVQLVGADLGLTLTSGCQLYPRMSVTAAIGRRT